MGGGYITQSAPTNFHAFYTTKLLTAAESPDDYMDVTAAQRQTMEANDAQWQAPSRDLVTQWDEVCGVHGRYNPDTGFFELNGITDLTEREAIGILSLGTPTSGGANFDNDRVRYNRYRTALPLVAGINCDLRGVYAGCDGLEVIRITNYYTEPSNQDTYKQFIRGTRSFPPSPNTIRVVKGVLHITYEYDTQHFYNATPKVLEEIWVSGINKNINALQYTPYLRLDCLQYMVANAANTTAITIKVHPTLMARMTDTDNTEWHQLLLDATAKNIQFTSD